jgi:hypothetical protein
MDDSETVRRTIQHYRRLRQWVTDLAARRALRELIRDAEGKLIERGGPEEKDRS